MTTLNLQRDENGLFVQITTERLIIRSVQLSDLNHYQTQLYGDPEVMGKVSYGITKSPESVEKRMREVWLKRWQSDFPFSAMAVLDKESGAFVGHVMLRDCKQPGVTEIHYLIARAHQRQGKGMEAASALIDTFVPWLLRESYSMHGRLLEKIIGTARADNFGSIRILETLFNHEKDEEKYGATRKFYAISL